MVEDNEEKRAGRRDERQGVSCRRDESNRVPVANKCHWFKLVASLFTVSLKETPPVGSRRLRASRRYNRPPKTSGDDDEDDDIDNNGSVTTLEKRRGRGPAAVLLILSVYRH